MIFILSQKAVLFIYLQTFFHRLHFCFICESGYARASLICLYFSILIITSLWKDHFHHLRKLRFLGAAGEKALSGDSIAVCDRGTDVFSRRWLPSFHPEFNSRPFIPLRFPRFPPLILHCFCHRLDSRILSKDNCSLFAVHTFPCHLRRT